MLLAYQGFERGVATFYDLPDIPCRWRVAEMRRYSGRLALQKEHPDLTKRTTVLLPRLQSKPLKGTTIPMAVRRETAGPELAVPVWRNCRSRSNANDTQQTATKRT